MPVSTITSQGRPVSRQRATCSGAVEHRPRRRVAAPPPCRRAGRRAAPTGSRSPGQGISASASAQVATKKSRQPACLEPLHRLARAEAVAVGLDRRAAGGAAARDGRASASWRRARRRRGSAAAEYGPSAAPSVGTFQVTASSPDGWSTQSLPRRLGQPEQGDDQRHRDHRRSCTRGRRTDRRCGRRYTG